MPKEIRDLPPVEIRRLETGQWAYRAHAGASWKPLSDVLEIPKGAITPEVLVEAQEFFAPRPVRLG